MKIVSPYRISHRYVQHLTSPPERVFPLLCPVRECDWVNGWNPEVVVSASGVAEPDCVFTVGGAVWVVTHYAPVSRIEFLKVTPGETVGWITIDLARDGETGTAATVRYTYVALSEPGRATLAGFTATAYEGFMREWERELNHYLSTGRKLGADERALVEEAR